MGFLSSITSYISSIITNECPPPVKQDDDKTTLTYALTIPESIFLVFAKTLVQKFIESGKDLMYISSKDLQSRFDPWLEKVVTQKKFSPEERDLTKIIESIWIKTKDQVKNLSVCLQDKDALTEEKQHHKNAKTMKESHGHSGKFFTKRQSKFLLFTLDKIEKA